MRWIEGRLAPIGGQAQYTFNFASRCRAIHSWYDLNEIHYVAYLCESNLYVTIGDTDVGASLVDITPGSGIAPPPIASQGGYGDGPYGADTYGTPRSVSDIQMLDALPPTWSLDNFGQILLAMASSDGRLLYWDPSQGSPGWISGVGTANGWAAGATTIQMISAVPPGGVGPGTVVFNFTSGTEVGMVASWADSTLTLAAGAISAGTPGSTLYFGNMAAPVVANPGRGVVPFGRSFVVTQERFVQIQGAFDSTGGSFRRFAWCDQENYMAWDYSSVTSQAGYLDIEPAAPIVSAKATPLGVLFWTASACYVSQFLGLPYVYNYVELQKNVTPWSPLSVASTSSMTLWFSQQGLYSYNGAFVTPLPCRIRPWIDDDIDLLNVRWQACAVHVAPFNEFWWFFPQDNQPYNTRVAIYNYKEGWWSMGQMARSAGITASYTVQTIMADGLNAFEHEVGNVYPASVPLPWAETFDLNLNSGSRLTTVKQLIPDIDGDVTNLLYSLFYRNSRSVMPDVNGVPILVQEMQTTPRKVNTSNGFVDLRTTGRDIRLRIALAGPQVLPVTVGQHLVDSVARGDR